MKPVYWIVLVVVVASLLVLPLFGKNKPSTVEVRQITPEDSSVLEEWIRVTNDEDILGVSAVRLDRAKWNWQLSVAAAEFVRREPLASRLDRDLTAALKKVKGVTGVAREDTEVWLVHGNPKGDDLVRACAQVLELLAPEIRQQLPKS